MFETEEEYQAEMDQLAGNIAALHNVQYAVSANGISREMVASLEDIEEGIITNDVPLTAFTVEPSPIFVEVGNEAIGEGISRAITAIGRAVKKAWEMLVNNIKKLMRRLFRSKETPRKVKVEVKEILALAPPKEFTEEQKVVVKDGEVSKPTISKAHEEWVRNAAAQEAFRTAIQKGWWETFPTTLDRYVAINYSEILANVDNAVAALRTALADTREIQSKLNQFKNLADMQRRSGDDQDLAYENGKDLISMIHKLTTTMEQSFSASETNLALILPTMDTVPGLEKIQEQDWTERQQREYKDLIPGDVMVRRISALSADKDGVGYTDAQLPVIDIVAYANGRDVDFDAVYAFAEKNMEELTEVPSYVDLTQQENINMLGDAVRPHTITNVEDFVAKVFYMIAAARQTRLNLAKTLQFYIKVLKLTHTVRLTAVDSAQRHGSKLAAGNVV